MLERMIDLRDRVLVLEQHTARGKRSGAHISQEFGTLFTLHDGLIVRWESYWDEPKPSRPQASRAPSRRGASAIAAMSKRT